MPRLQSIATDMQHIDWAMSTTLSNSTGCGRKNSPIWEGHSFGWGGRTVVGSASSSSGVRAVFSVHRGVIGRASSLYCWGVYKKWRVAGSNTACISHPQIWPPTIFFSGATSKQRFTNNVPRLWKLWRRRYDRKLLSLSRSRTSTERCYISVSIFKAATWVMFCSKHVDVKGYSVCFPEIKKNICRIFFSFEFISFPNRGLLSAASCIMF